MQPGVKAWELTEPEMGAAWLSIQGDFSHALVRRRKAIKAAQNAKTIREVVKWLRDTAAAIANPDYIFAYRWIANDLEQAARAAGYKMEEGQ